MHLHDMWSLGTEIGWPSKKHREHKQPRIHNHHISLRDRLKELQSKSHHGKRPVHHGNHNDNNIPETTKAVAWAVFQHHGSGLPGTGFATVGHGGHAYGSHAHHGPMAVRRPTRFKIEAQMKHEIAHRSFAPEVTTVRWDAGSTLLDAFELDSLLKTLDQAAHHAENVARTHDDDGKQSITHREHNELQKHGHHGFGHGMWKHLLHSLHLDGSSHGLFHGLHMFQSQVAPHDSDPKGRSTHKNGTRHSHSHSHSHSDVSHFLDHFDRNEVHVTKDAHSPGGEEEEEGHHRHRHRRHSHSFDLWKLLTHPFHHGHKSHEQEHDVELSRHLAHKQAELRSAWAAFTANLPQHPERRSGQFGTRREGEDSELTMQAISKRVARASFEHREVGASCVDRI